MVILGLHLNNVTRVIPTNLSWIISISYSHHVAGTFSSLMDVIDVCPCPVGILDGTSIMATKEGILYLTPRITLHLVLFVHQINYFELLCLI